MTDLQIVPAIDMDGWVCPLPLRDTPFIVMVMAAAGRCPAS